MDSLTANYPALGTERWYDVLIGIGRSQRKFTAK